jgi:hypothetical protein
MLSTPSFGNPSFKNFVEHEANCISFSLLLDPSMPNRFPFKKPHPPFGSVIHHPFFDGHVLK